VDGRDKAFFKHVSVCDVCLHAAEDSSTSIRHF